MLQHSDLGVLVDELAELDERWLDLLDPIDDALLQ
jgi:hypothetical protein